MASIFINYRREDGAGYAGRLHDALAARFGRESVFRDVDALSPGQDFNDVITEHIRRSAVQLVVIGPEWLTARDRKGQRRIDNPHDYVRTEIRAALSSDVPVVPVLVAGATMPPASELPEDIRAITRRQAVELVDSRWDDDVKELLERLALRVSATPAEPQGARYSNTAPPAPMGSKALKHIGTAVGVLAAGVSAMGALFARKKTQPDRDQVKCSVFAASEARAGDAVLIQVFAHLPGDEARVKAVAQTFDHRASGRAAKLLDQEVKRETPLTFSLTLPGIGVEEPTRSLVWRGEPDAVNFTVNVPSDQREGRLIGTVLVTQNSIPFAHLKFILDIVAKPVTVPLESSPPEQTWKRYQHAFISYASEDRAEVLKRTQMLKLMRIDFFQDLLSLDPGERWEKTLYRKIDESDVFFLFWSTAAKQSEYVIKEVRYAIGRHRGDEMAPPEIVPVMIEGPPPVAPPSELKDLHFNDSFLYFIAGTARDLSTAEKPEV